MFKIGDKVRVIKGYGYVKKGEKGIIRALPGKNGAASNFYKDFYSVEFPAWTNGVDGHNCGGTVPSKKGLWLLPKYLELVEKQRPGIGDRIKIVITHDGKTTLARLYEDNKVVKSATAKCSPDDTFDFETGAKLAFERLIGGEKKEEPPKFDKSMLTNGRFGYMSGGQGWFVVVGDKIIYENGGYDWIEKMTSSGRYPSGYGVKYIVDACSFQDAKATHRKAIWCAPDFDIWPVAK